MPDPTSEQVQTLAVWLDEHIAGALRFIYGAGADHVQVVEELLSQTAPALLASDWLRDRIAAERADAARQALAPVLAERDAWRAAVAEVVRDHDMPPRKDSHGYDYRMGWWDAVTHADRLIRYRVRAATEGGEGT